MAYHDLGANVFVINQVLSLNGLYCFRREATALLDSFPFFKHSILRANLRSVDSESEQFYQIRTHQYYV